MLDPEVQGALERRAVECDRSVDEMASMILSCLLLAD
jgi:hypothetical protein